MKDSSGTNSRADSAADPGCSAALNAPRPAGGPRDPSRGSVGRGAALLMGARGVFFVSGYVVQIVLVHFLEQSYFGIWGLILGVLQVGRTATATGPGRAISRFTALHSDAPAAVRREGMKLLLGIGGGLGLAMLAGAPLLARLLGDPALTPYLRITGLFMPMFGLYSLYLGSLNGVRAFGRQALVMASYSFLRMTAIVAFLLFGAQLFGVLTASWLGLCLAVLVGRRCQVRSDEPAPVTWTDVGRFAVPVSLFALALTVFRNLDVFMVKALIGANDMVGVYAAARVIAMVPQAALFGVSAALFPAVAHALHDSDPKRLQSYITRSWRYCLLVLTPFALLVAAVAGELVVFVYTDEYAPSAEPLRVLVFGYVLISLFHVGTTIITALGHPRFAMGLAFIMLLVDVLLTRLLIPPLGLPGAALATTLSALGGVLCAVIWLARRFGPLVPLHSLLRIVLCALGVAALGIMCPMAGVRVLFGFVILGAVYAGLLALLGELNHADRRLFREMLSPRKTS